MAEKIIFSEVTCPDIAPSLLEMILGNGFITALFLVGVTALLVWSGILNYFETYRYYAQRGNSIASLVDKYMGAIPSTATAHPKTNISMLTVNSSKKSASILCSNAGKSYLITLPYSPERVSAMRTKKMILLGAPGGEFDVTTPPGIAYMFSAESLGGSELQLRSTIDNSVIKTYKQAEVPGFAG
jgi:hypothetical protein